MIVKRDGKQLRIDMLNLNLNAIIWREHYNTGNTTKHGVSYRMFKYVSCNLVPKSK